MDKRQIRKAVETARDIYDAFGQVTISESTAQWWFKEFRSCGESFEDEERSGRPHDVDNDELKGLVEANPGTTVRELDVDISTTSNGLESQKSLINGYRTN
ncbi:unnamed protein product [Acanthoscelides obtectus]|uniref:Mos1 transposase HTH domain-containing protein n=1 Tax=Acanthoscelides obtectus TaxID=200917 RepID=A0A9P0KJZ4_ACAOB|nr:unnamed protein product [Acanthoscelides obtectus]CAK1625691.1 Histone-lysine N-methyltransferase SETMAR [Acanthoscelides obtectus]